MSNIPSFLSVGRSGHLPDGESVRVAGRIRFSYGSGIWDEWWIENDADGYWLEEDDGQYYRHALVQGLPWGADTDALQVGRTLDVEGVGSLFITEKYHTEVVGFEGMLPVAVERGEKLLCVDGRQGEREFSLEIQEGALTVTEAHEFRIYSVKWS